MVTPLLILRIPKTTAEEVKLRWGLALASLASADEVVTLPGTGDGEGEIRREIIAAIMEPRCEEIFSMIKSAVSKDPHFQAAGSTVVLTGGGSRIDGLEGVAGQVFERPVRTGRPGGLDGLSEIVENESWSAAVGIILFEKDRLEREEQVLRGRGRLGSMLMAADASGGFARHDGRERVHAFDAMPFLVHRQE